ncbi:MAG TPA: DMT family protein [Candidatus Brocadiia bacterium]|nr:DMT family protein [Candidatus Brocadiia bacterium]
MRYVWPVALLIISNLFMTTAWYGHLKPEFKAKPLALVVVVSWLIAFVEYCFQVPANRLGNAVYSVAELKTIQEIITLVVFVGFSALYLGESVKWNQLVGFAFLVPAAAFVFWK